MKDTKFSDQNPKPMLRHMGYGARCSVKFEFEFEFEFSLEVEME